MNNNQMYYILNKKIENLLGKNIEDLNRQELKEINHKARIESLKYLPVAIAFIIIGGYGFTPHSREFESSINFTPIPSLTPLLHFLMNIVVPTGMLLMGLYALFGILGIIVKGGSEADKRAYLKLKFKEKYPEIVLLECSHCMSVTECRKKELSEAICSSCSRKLLSNKDICPCGSGKRFENCHGLSK